MVIIGAVLAGCASSAPIAPAPNPPMPISNPGGQAQSHAGSGIYGTMVAARGTAPANPSYECVRVYDASGRKLVATAICSGPMASFRLPLAPGSYVVEAGGHWESANGRAYFRPNRQPVEIGANQRLRLGAQAPPGPVP
ncbi:MAG: hypothetical protein ACREQ4_06635 [Candidatus Binataceae bacterium]